MDYLLPCQYVILMKQHLLDKCPVSDMEQVRRTVERDFGVPLEAAFKYFDPKPIASASLAQVHVAYDYQGRKLAVKVQHGELQDQARVDLGTLSFLIAVVEFLVP